MLPSILLIAVIGTYFACFWKLFEKAGKKKWEGLVPGYNAYVWLKILGKPWWWLLLLLIPGVNFMMLVIMNVELSRVYGKRSLTDALTAIFLPFVSIPSLTFNEQVKYEGPRDFKVYRKSKMQEWGEAIVFAVVAATIIRTFFLEAFTIPTPSMEKSLLVGDYLFVSKMSYGTRLPNTPITIPFTHHSLFPTTRKIKSYVEWYTLPYLRLPGFGSINRSDVVVFNFPEGDTVLVDIQDQSYYQIVRNEGQRAKMDILASGAPDNKPDSYYYSLARRSILEQYEITVRPVDKRENYIKRCVGIAGDELKVVNGQVFCNNEPVGRPEEAQIKYEIRTTGSLSKRIAKERFNISLDEMRESQSQQNLYIVPLSYAQVEQMRADPIVVSVEPYVDVFDLPDSLAPEFGIMRHIFPNHPTYNWTPANFGPLYIPKAGDKLELTTTNLPLYMRAISFYEGNTVKVEGEDIFINGEKATSYTFRMNYYFMMGDNRNNSQDSRYWGMVPEDHVVGKAVFIWLSKDKDVDGFFSNIRWSRMFSFIR